MKTYVVGGAVRDALLNLPVSDRDHVVVGATPEDMVRAGFRPVGADFPVFLHPESQEEYALARTERKTAPGYKGFVFHTSPDVTLEEDLLRRDLTINAMARGEDGQLIDPWGGEQDLQARTLRHVSDAFREDPVRILRTARFAARFARLGFSIAPATLQLMRDMVIAGEVDALVAERVWQELARGLMTTKPARMIEVLQDCGALSRLLPEIVGHASDLAVLDAAADCEYSQEVRYAALFIPTHSLADQASPAPKQPEVEAASQRIKVPAECRDLAVLGARWVRRLISTAPFNAEELLSVLEGTDALRRPQRFQQLLNLGRAAHLVLAGKGALPWSGEDWIIRALYCVQSIDFGQIAVRGGDIPTNIRNAKLEALGKFIQENPQ